MRTLRWAKASLLASTILAGAAQAENAPGSVEDVVVTATWSERSLIEVPASVALQSLEELQALGFTYGTEEFCGRANPTYTPRAPRQVRATLRATF